MSYLSTVWSVLIIFPLSAYKVLQEDSSQGGYDPHPVPPQTQGGVSQPPPYMMSNVADYQPAPPAMGAQQQTNTVRIRFLSRHFVPRLSAEIIGQYVV